MQAMQNHSTMGRPKRLGLISLGCPKNTVDSERILGELHALGWEFTDRIDEADCLMVNTCGFIRDAVLESEEVIEEICAVKEEHPEVILVVTGCLPQRLTASLRERFPEIDLIVGVGSLPDLPRLLDSIRRGERHDPSSEGSLCLSGRATLSLSDHRRLRLTPHWTAYVKIAEGCDHECAFCTIPFIKGRHISRPVPDLVKEAEQLASEGVREIILIGQDTTAYGTDIGTNLRALLKELDKVDGLAWIRLLYMYPSKISDALLDTIAQSRRVLPYFDIPLQHVQPHILRAMGRLAPDLDAAQLIERIRRHFENGRLSPCIRTTLMVGFPGETDEDEQALLEFLQAARIDRLTVFQFSAEEGTCAPSLPDQVPEPVAEARYHRLMEAQQAISLEVNEEWVGRTIDVLLEGETDDGRRVGRSFRDAPEIDGLVIVGNVPETVPSGALVRARVIGALPYDLEATWLPWLPIP